MKFLKKLFLILFALFMLIFAATALFIVLGPVNYSMKTEKYIGVVFGAGITRSGDPSIALKLRLDKSVDIYRNKLIRKIFISGKIAETFVMKNYLIKKKISVSNIVIDYNGNNTYDTIANVNKYLKYNRLPEDIVFISQKYHIPRITLIAVRLGIRNAFFVAADHRKIDRDDQFFFIFRETLAYIKTLIFNLY